MLVGLWRHHVPVDLILFADPGAEQPHTYAYLDIMDDDPTTESYKNFLHLGTEINESNLTRYQEIFRKRKNRYRRWRDLSVFATIAVYALSVIDAYVDASLSEFDISEDLSLRPS